MSRGKPPVEVEEYVDRSTRLETGELPTIALPNLSDWLAHGEVVHHVAHPVFTGDYHLPDHGADGGTLIVTDRRLIFCTAEACSSAPYEGIEELEAEYPGFFVKLRGEPEPRHFYPPSLDPVFPAVVGALKNFRQAQAAQ